MKLPTNFPVARATSATAHTGNSVIEEFFTKIVRVLRISAKERTAALKNGVYQMCERPVYIDPVVVVMSHAHHENRRFIFGEMTFRTIEPTRTLSLLAELEYGGAILHCQATFGFEDYTSYMLLYERVCRLKTTLRSCYNAHGWMCIFVKI